MQYIVHAVKLFGHPEEKKWDEKRLGIALDALVAENLAFLAMRDEEGRLSEIPWLYSAGCRYELDPPGIELFANIPTVIDRRGGDCEDLAAWRVAELRYRCKETAAKIYFYGRVLENGHRLYHIQVMRGNGRIEDPSRVLGM